MMRKRKQQKKFFNYLEDNFRSLQILDKPNSSYSRPRSRVTGASFWVRCIHQITINSKCFLIKQKSNNEINYQIAFSIKDQRRGLTHYIINFHKTLMSFLWRRTSITIIPLSQRTKKPLSENFHIWAIARDTIFLLIKYLKLAKLNFEVSFLFAFVWSLSP